MATEWKPLPIGRQITFAIKQTGIVVAYDRVAARYTIATGPVGNPDRLVIVNVGDVYTDAT